MVPQALARVEQELERIGLLLEHDTRLPSVTSLASGEPIAGSWWGHPQGHAIYDLLHELAERSGALDVKLVNGKVTYVHPRLWPAFLALALDTAPARVRGLSALDRKLLAKVQQDGPQRVDLLQRTGFAPGKELTAAARKLDARLLVQTASVHTDRGAHARQLQSWPSWVSTHAEGLKPLALPDARSQLSDAARALASGSSHPVKLAL